MRSRNSSVQGMICAAMMADTASAARSICAKLATIVFLDRKSTRLNSSHSQISYAVFCLKKKNKTHTSHIRTDLIELPTIAPDPSRLLRGGSVQLKTTYRPRLTENAFSHTKA